MYNEHVDVQNKMTIKQVVRACIGLGHVNQVFLNATSNDPHFILCNQEIKENSHKIQT